MSGYPAFYIVASPLENHKWLLGVVRNKAQNNFEYNEENRKALYNDNFMERLGNRHAELYSCLQVCV